MRIIVMVALTAGVVSTGWASPGETGFKLLLEPVNARFSAMSGAATALGGAGFFYYNPALPGLLEENYLNLEYGQDPGDMQTFRLETAWSYAHWFWGLGFQTHTIGSIIAADERGPDESIDFSSQDMHPSIDVGFKRGDFSLGLCFNGVSERIENYTEYALSLSGGAAYRIFQRKLTFGLAAFHGGITEGMMAPDNNWGQGPLLPWSVRGGVSWIDTLRFSSPSPSFNTIAYALAIDVIYDKENELVRVPVGLEVWPINYLAIRLGKRFNDEVDVVDCGLGLRILPMTVDVSIGVEDWAGSGDMKWAVGIGYVLVNKPAGARRPAAHIEATPAEPAKVKPTSAFAPEEEVVPATRAVKPAAVADTALQRDSLSIQKNVAGPDTLKAPGAVPPP